MPIDTSTPTASSISFNEGVLRLAAVHEREVTFRYVKGNDPSGPIETRTLVPQTPIVTAPDAHNQRHKSFNGFDPDRGAFRHYRLDRIVGDVKFT